MHHARANNATLGFFDHMPRILAIAISVKIMRIFVKIRYGKDRVAVDARCNLGVPLLLLCEGVWLVGSIETDLVPGDAPVLCFGGDSVTFSYFFTKIGSGFWGKW